MRALAAVAGAGLAAILLLAAPIGSSAEKGPPDGWRRAPSPLVPNLVMPREVLSIGNFGMAVGGGGDCGREPVAAIHRMGPGDALITVQEYRVTAAMRNRFGENFPALPTKIDPGGFRRSPLSGAAGTPVQRATISFSGRGRAFDALVYVAGRPTPALQQELGAILGSFPI